MGILKWKAMLHWDILWFYILIELNVYFQFLTAAWKYNPSRIRRRHFRNWSEWQDFLHLLQHIGLQHDQLSSCRKLRDGNLQSSIRQGTFNIEFVLNAFCLNLFCSAKLSCYLVGLIRLKNYIFPNILFILNLWNIWK